MIQFLYPSTRQFPFDEACGQIVRELEKHNWQVPGIEVEFHEYGFGSQKFNMVSRIKGRYFRLWFCRAQRTINRQLNDIAAVADIVIPGKELHVYKDEAGPNFYLYVGDDYERDRKKFMNGQKIHSKLKGEPKMYLRYDGGCDCRVTAGASFDAIGFLDANLTGDAEKLARLTHAHPGRRSPLIVHTNDLGREYDPEGNEPKFFRTAEVMEEFKQYLEEVVLNMIVQSKGMD